MANTPKTHTEDNWSAAGVVRMFESASLTRARRRHRRLTAVLCLLVTIVLGIPLAVGWYRLQDARRQTLIEEFVTRRQAAETLPTIRNPAVERRLKSADELRQQANSGSVIDAVATLRKALRELAEATRLDQQIEDLRPLLNPLGETLSPEGSPRETSQWLVSSSVIAQRLAKLQRRHGEIVALLDAGNVEQAQQALATLLRDVGQLQRDNVQAMHTQSARSNWLRLQARIPERLKQHSAMPAITRAGQDAENGWDAGDWTNASLLFAGAAEDLEQFLQTETSPQEKAQLLQSDAEAVARLETEKADLLKQIDDLRQDKSNLADQLAATNGERQRAEQTLTETIRQRDQLKQAQTTADAELAELRPLKPQLAKTSQELEAAQTHLQELTRAKATVDEALARIEKQVAAKEAEITALRSAATTGDGSGAIVQVSATLARIESQLADGTAIADAHVAAETLRERLADTLQQYDTAVQERQTAIAEKWRPTSTRVQAIDATIAQAEQTLRSALAALDRPLSDQYAALQTLIDNATGDHQQLLKEVLPDHPDAVNLTRRIDGLQAQQTQLKPSHDRLNDNKSPAASELLSICRSHVTELLRRRQLADFERLRSEGKVPSALKMEMMAIAPGTFLMGSENGDYDEKPVHEVTITRPFFAGKYEVTIGQILTWLNTPDVTVRDDWIDFESSGCPVKKSGSGYILNTGTSLGESPEQPMVEISQIGAKAFCDWCSRQDPRFTYRLPTEAEWEYMARAGSTTEFPWGDSCNGTEANINGKYPFGTEKEGPYHQKTVRVGSYRPNDWGLYDTVGNCWEWCSDIYDSGYYSSSRATDPTGPGSGSSVVRRGGGWSYNGINARSGSRDLNSPDYTDYDIGFRVVAE